SSDVLAAVLPPSVPAPLAAGELLARPDPGSCLEAGPAPGRCAAAGLSPALGAGTMVLSVPVIALGATLGTATSILALCGVTCLCRHMHPKKGLLPRDQDPDPEKAKPGVLRSAQQVSGRRRAGPPGARGEAGGKWARQSLAERGDSRGAGGQAKESKR
ncbi:hypothetical protein P7K49_021878, partial [Saguinus oedipus]